MKTVGLRCGMRGCDEPRTGLTRYREVFRG